MQSSASSSNLPHAVRDVHDGDATVPQGLKDAEDSRDVRGGECRRRLVEDQDPRIASQGLGDLHHLAARERQIAHRGERVDVRGTHPLERFFSEPPLCARVDEAQPPGWVGEADVVRHGQVGQQGEFLEDADDPGPGRVGRPIEHDRGPRQLQRAGVRLQYPSHHLDEGGLPGPVLTQNGVDAPTPALEVGALQRAHAAEVLADALHSEQRAHGLTRRRREWATRSSPTCS